MKARTWLLIGAWLVFVVAGTLFVLRAAGHRAALEIQERQAKARAAAAVADLRDRLQARLGAALAEGGPAGAIEVCAAEAQAMSAELRTTHGGGDPGFVLGRTALRWRNPANAPGPYEEEWMRRTGAHTTGAAPYEPVGKVEEFLDGRRLLHYWQPIYVQPACLSCHGAPAEIAPEVREVLAQRYPGDQALGFANGDFRGLFVVRVPLPKLEQ